MVIMVQAGRIARIACRSNEPTAGRMTRGQEVLIVAKLGPIDYRGKW